MVTKCIAFEQGENWIVYRGDCCDVIQGLPDNSIGYTIFSPPFASLYTYSDSPRDMGNARNYNEFWEHFNFLIPELLRVMMPGRLCSVHCMNLPTTKQHHGEIGIEDFRGDIIATFKSLGWIYHSEVCIWKDPVTAMQRTKALGLLHKQLVKDSCLSRQGIPDYVCTFRKTGVNPRPVAGRLTQFVGDPTVRFKHEGDLSIDIWQQYASPVWMDINPTRTLQYRSARHDNDERHICTLQLDVIERCLDLWSLEGDTVLSPFAGIGSEGWCSVLRGRKYVGIELKDTYYREAIGNMEAAEKQAKQAKLF